MHPLGAFSSVVSCWASYSLTENMAEIAPSFFAVNEIGAKEKRIDDKSGECRIGRVNKLDIDSL